MKSVLLASIGLVGILSVLNLAHALEAPRPGQALTKSGPALTLNCAVPNTCAPSCPAGFVLSNVGGSLPSSSLLFTCSMAVMCPPSGFPGIPVTLGPVQVAGNRVSFTCDYVVPTR
jgi:hypothetical protein